MDVAVGTVLNDNTIHFNTDARYSADYPAGQWLFKCDSGYGIYSAGPPHLWIATFTLGNDALSITQSPLTLVKQLNDYSSGQWYESRYYALNWGRVIASQTSTYNNVVSSITDGGSGGTPEGISQIVVGMDLSGKTIVFDTTSRYSGVGVSSFPMFTHFVRSAKYSISCMSGSPNVYFGPVTGTTDYPSTSASSSVFCYNYSGGGTWYVGDLTLPDDFGVVTHYTTSAAIFGYVDGGSTYKPITVGTALSGKTLWFDSAARYGDAGWSMGTTMLKSSKYSLTTVSGPPSVFYGPLDTSWSSTQPDPTDPRTRMIASHSTGAKMEYLTLPDDFGNVTTYTTNTLILGYTDDPPTPPSEDKLHLLNGVPLYDWIDLEKMSTIFTFGVYSSERAELTQHMWDGGGAGKYLKFPKAVISGMPTLVNTYRSASGGSTIYAPMMGKHPSTYTVGMIHGYEVVPSVGEFMALDFYPDYYSDRSFSIDITRWSVGGSYLSSTTWISSGFRTAICLQLATQGGSAWGGQLSKNYQAGAGGAWVQCILDLAKAYKAGRKVAITRESGTPNIMRVGTIPMGDSKLTNFIAFGTFTDAPVTANTLEVAIAYGGSFTGSYQGMFWDYNYGTVLTANASAGEYIRRGCHVNSTRTLTYSAWTPFFKGDRTVTVSANGQAYIGGMTPITTTALSAGSTSTSRVGYQNSTTTIDTNSDWGRNTTYMYGMGQQVIYSDSNSGAHQSVGSCVVKLSY